MILAILRCPYLGMLQNALLLEFVSCFPHGWPGVVSLGQEDHGESDVPSHVAEGAYLQCALSPWTLTLITWPKRCSSGFVLVKLLFHSAFHTVVFSKQSLFMLLFSL